MMNQIRKHLDFLLTDMERSPAFYVWVSILVALVGLATYSLLMSLIYNMEIFEFSIHVIWVTLVSNYVFLVVSSTGLCIVSSLGHVFGMKRYELIGKRGVFLALITILFGMTSIGLHLGHPERAMVWNALTPNGRSAIWWMGTLYSLYIAFIGVECWLLLRADLKKTAYESEGFKAKVYSLLAIDKLDDSRIGPVLKDHRLHQLVGALALISGLSAHNTLGAVFGHTEARAFWYGAYYPVYFLLSAAFCGFAWLLASAIATYKIKREKIPDEYRALIFEMAQVLALLLAVGFLFTTYKIGTGLFVPDKAKVIMLFLTGSFSKPFWLFEIAMGTVLPIFVLLYAVRRNKITGVLVASVMVLVGVFVMRYDFIVAAQVYPVLNPYSFSYLPTMMEVLLIAGILGGFFLAYSLGEKFLPLKEDGPGHAQLKEDGPGHAQ